MLELQLEVVGALVADGADTRLLGGLFGGHVLGLRLGLDGCGGGDSGQGRPHWGYSS